MGQTTSTLEIKFIEGNLKVVIKSLSVFSIKELEDLLFGDIHPNAHINETPDSIGDEGGDVAVKVETLKEIEPSALLREIWNAVQNTNLSSIILGTFDMDGVPEVGAGFVKGNLLDSFYSEVPVVILFTADYLNTSAKKGMTDLFADYKIKQDKKWNIYFLGVNCDPSTKEDLRECSEVAEFKIWFVDN